MSPEATLAVLSPHNSLPKVEGSLIPQSHILEIQGLKGNEIAYNPAKPIFQINPTTNQKKEIMPIRVEDMESHFMHMYNNKGVYNPRIDFAERVGQNGTWKIVDHNSWNLASTVKDMQGLEDPSWASIDGLIVLGGVRARVNADGRARITTELFAGKSFQTMKQIAEIDGKDNRFLQRPDGRILWAFRPQGGKAGPGRMGFIIIEKLDHLNRTRTDNVPIMYDQVPEDMWIGPNEMQNIGHTRVGVLAHVAARVEGGIRHYAPAAFILENANSVDRETPVTSPVEIIGKASDYPKTPNKAPDLTHVLFPGFLNRKGNGYADLGVGKNDCRIVITENIPDPFLRVTV